MGDDEPKVVIPPGTVVTSPSGSAPTTTPTPSGSVPPAPGPGTAAGTVLTGGATKTGVGGVSNTPPGLTQTLAQQPPLSGGNPGPPNQDPNVPAVGGYNNVGGPGVLGATTTGADGVFGQSASGNGVHGQSQSGNAGYFEGNVIVTGNLNLGGTLANANNNLQVAGNLAVTGNASVNGNANVNGNTNVNGTLAVGVDIILPATAADCAEEFDIGTTQEVEPGTVMVLDQGESVRPSEQGYDKRVAGVVSGAGGYRPAVILDRRDSAGNRMPIALVGKVFCKVDAQYGAVEVGDLLTTSPTLGHAMKASDPSLAFGAVIGKALRPLPGGKGLIPVLIALQ